MGVALTIMGNSPAAAAAPAPAPPEADNRMEAAISHDIERIQTTYNRHAETERQSTQQAFDQQLKTDDPFKYYNKGGELGTGAYGAVFAVTCKRTGQEYAMKQINTTVVACKPEMLQ